MTTLHGVYLNFDEAIAELKKLESKYGMSTGADSYLEFGLSAKDPYYEMKNQRWEIVICNDKIPEHAYCCIRPYEVRCQNHIDKRKK